MYQLHTWEEPCYLRRGKGSAEDRTTDEKVSLKLQIKSSTQVSQSPLWSSTRVLFCRSWVPSAMKERTLALYLILAALGRIRLCFTVLLLCIAMAFSRLHWMFSPPEFAKSNQKYYSDWEIKDEGRNLGDKEVSPSSTTLSPFESTWWEGSRATGKVFTIPWSSVDVSSARTSV